ncbi:MAG TPA: CaiB/BaiF CoA-transferase family protein, partial [Thermomicrobiales bacterium]|nr:CaiB/BaiF CoA-transferase family protein [Thermomicrobiales bacterium]
MRNQSQHPVGPLTGITVLALEQALAGPLCTRHLGDMGARVIKIERTGGGDLARSYDTTVHGNSSYFVWLNRGKESVALDLKHPAAAGILQALVRQADVVVQNLAPGAADRLGVGPDQVLASYPEKIYCSISGYGEGGPYEQRKAFDLLLQGETGVIATTGNGEDLAKVGISVGDIGAGVYGAMAILGALLERNRTGLGQHVQSSLFDALGEWMGYPLYFTMYGGTPPARAGVRHATVVPYGAYRCGDGDQVLLAVQSDLHWRNFCQIVLERPEWIDDLRFNTVPNRRINRDDLESAIEAIFQQWDRSEVNRRLEQADIPSGDLNTIAQFAEHPQLTSRDRWAAVDVPG